MERKETLEAICERIKALEGEVCALRVQNKRMRVVIAALVVFAALPYLIAAGMYTQTFSVLRVERIEFVQDGELAAIMRGKVIPGIGSELDIYDKAGTLVVAISSATDGPFAGVQGLTVGERGRVGLVITREGNGCMGIYNQYGKCVVLLSALSTKGMKRVGGFLSIYDGDGNKILDAYNDPVFNGVCKP